MLSISLPNSVPRFLLLDIPSLFVWDILFLYCVVLWCSLQELDDISVEDRQQQLAENMGDLRSVINNLDRAKQRLDGKGLIFFKSPSEGFYTRLLQVWCGPSLLYLFGLVNLEQHWSIRLSVQLLLYDLVVYLKKKCSLPY